MTTGYSRSEPCPGEANIPSGLMANRWRVLPAERYAIALIVLSLIPWLMHIFNLDAVFLMMLDRMATRSGRIVGSGSFLAPAIVFACLHMVACVVAGMTAALASVHWIIRRDAVASALALASFIAMLFNAAQWMMVFGLVPMAGSYHETAFRVWNCGGIVHGALLTVGVLVFYPYLRNRRVRRGAGKWTALAASIGLPMAVLLIAWLLATMPARSGWGGFSAMAVYVTGAAMAGPLLYRRSRRLILAVVGLSLIPFTAAQVYMLFSNHGFGGAGPVAAAALQIVGYAVPLAGLLWEYVAAHRHSARLLRRLRLEVKVRTHAEQRATETAAHLERRVAERTAELQAAMDELDQFARMASHDLQEPLNKQIMFTTVLTESTDDLLSPNARLAVDAIQSGAQRMQFLVKDLMALARSGNSPLHLERFDLTASLRDALDDLEPRMVLCGATVTAGPLPEVYGDRGLITQLFANLIGNAIKFVAPGVAPAIHVTAENMNGLECITVADNGIGIAAHAANDIFRPFHRLHPRGRFDGSGLGLSICRKIVERHGGTIWCESTPGQGSRFHFQIPTATNAPPAAVRASHMDGLAPEPSEQSPVSALGESDVPIRR